MSGSTGTVETGTLSDVLSTRGLIQVRSCPMNRYLSESRKESPILLVEMEWEGQAMSESDSPASDSLETDLLPRNRFLASPTLEGMLFLVHLFFFSFFNTGRGQMGLLSASRSISSSIVHSIFYRP